MAIGPTRRKVFLSFHQADEHEVDDFIEQWAYQAEVFLPRFLGVADNADLINSDNPEYVMSQIREHYLGDSTVTIVLIGTCTHSRRYVDWELKSSLRRGSFTPNGVMGIALPSTNGNAHLPPRFKANWNRANVACYTRFWGYPRSAMQLRGWIEDAHGARSKRVRLINNSADMMKYNARCEACGITH